MIITLVATYQVREGLRVQCEQDWPKDRTLWNPELKGARRCQPSQTVHGPLNRTQTSEAVPEIPNVVSSLCNNMGWSSVSNAALRSSKASTETSPSSAFLRRPSTTLSRAVSVLWFFLYADCLILPGTLVSFLTQNCP